MTLSEMQAFVQELEARPRARLLADLPQLLLLTESKFRMAERVLLRRLAALGSDERAQFRALLSDEAKHASQPGARERAERLLAALGSTPGAH